MAIFALWRKLNALLAYAEGTEIIEFAVSLPLLVVLVVGIYDFGSAFTLKNKLNTAVREGVRLASSQARPADPLAAAPGCGAPASVCLVRDVVAANLQATIGDDCGLSGVTGTTTSPNPYTWIFTGGCSGLSLKVERDLLNANTATLPSPFSSAPYVVESSRVTLSYPYQWKFNGVFKILDGNSNYLSSTITVTTTMQNLD